MLITAQMSGWLHYWVMHSITQDLETRADYCSDEWMVEEESHNSGGAHQPHRDELQ